MNLVFPDHGIMKPATMELPHAVSDRELLEISEKNQGFQVEWYGKERLLVVSPSGSESSAAALALGAQLRSWARKRRNGRAFGADGGFRLRDGSILSPDAAWASAETLRSVPNSDRQGYPAFCPDLVIEVKSPSNSLPYLSKKCRRWVSSGSEAAILVDPEKRNAELFQPGNVHSILDGDRIEISAFPGLSLNLAEVREESAGL